MENPLATRHTAMKMAIPHSKGEDFAIRSTCFPNFIARIDSTVKRAARVTKLMRRMRHRE